MEKLSLAAKLFLFILAVLIIGALVFFVTLKFKQSSGIEGSGDVGVDNINKLINSGSSDHKELPLNVQITSFTDKLIYRSYENILLYVDLVSNNDLDGVTISAKGITSSLGKNYFDQSQIVTLQKGSVKEIKLNQSLPSCNSCSGLAPGNYEIDVTVSYQGIILGLKKIILTIKQ